MLKLKILGPEILIEDPGHLFLVIIYFDILLP